jgi:hypothetical protein
MQLVAQTNCNQQQNWARQAETPAKDIATEKERLIKVWWKCIEVIR